MHKNSFFNAWGRLNTLMPFQVEMKFGTLARIWHTLKNRPTNKPRAARIDFLLSLMQSCSFSSSKLNLSLSENKRLSHKHRERMFDHQIRLWNGKKDVGAKSRGKRGREMLFQFDPHSFPIKVLIKNILLSRALAKFSPEGRWNLKSSYFRQGSSHFSLVPAHFGTLPLSLRRTEPKIKKERKKERVFPNCSIAPTLT